MHRQRLIWLGFIGFVVVGIFLACYYLRPQRRYPDSWSNFNKITKGMTTEAVIAILGPPTDTLAATEVPSSAEGKAVRVARWFGWRGMGEVAFGENDTVEWKRYTEGARNHHLTFWEQLWLGPDD
jgi:hypothetical protein